MKEPIIIRKNSPRTHAPSSTEDLDQRRQVFHFYLRTLTPIHVGCDEVYEPMCFVMDESTETMTVFDAEVFLNNLTGAEREEFSGICKEGSITSILKIYKFISKHKPQGRQIRVSPGLLGHYKRTLALPLNNEKTLKNELNRFMIGRTSFLPTTNRPYIPGSALKGAFRTAYLNQLAGSESTSNFRDARDLEKHLMGGSFNSDPFRFLKVSDFMPVGAVTTHIVYAINEKKKSSKFDAKGPYQILEVVPAGSVFKGVVSIDFPLKSGQVARPLTPDNLFKSVSAFFGNEMKLEEQTFRAINLERRLKPDAKGLLLRVGRHSGAESLTIERFRSIKIMKGRGERPAYGEAATTIWLASEYDKRRPNQVLEPFGWVELLKYSEDQISAMESLEAEWQQSFEAIQSNRGTELRNRNLLEVKIDQTPKAPTEEVWNSAFLSWDPGRQQVIANLGTKKAFATGKEIIPENIQKPLVQKKKVLKANVTVNSSYKILKIEPV